MTELAYKSFFVFYSSIAFLCVLKHFNNGNAVPTRSPSKSPLPHTLPRRDAAFTGGNELTSSALYCERHHHFISGD